MIPVLAELQGPDYIILVGYFVLMLAIGGYFYRYMRDMKAYFSGGNQIPWWLSGVSFYMTSFTAFLFVAYSEIAYRHGLVAVVLGWTVVPAVLIGALFFSSRWRRARIDSPVEYLEERYSLGLRQAFGWANVPIRMIDNGLRLYATGLFVSGTVGLDLETSIWATGGITLAYTFAGGLWAATVTDFVQFLVMMAGALVLVPLSVVKAGGLGALASGGPPGFFQPTAGPFTGTYLVAWFILVLCNYNTSFGLVQRYYCVRDEREARRTGLLVAVLVLIGTPLFFLPAMAATRFLPDADPKDIYATLCVTLLPAGALGLIIAAMFSATMSSLSGDYNAVAAVLTNDVYKRLLNPCASERRLVAVGRIATFLMGLIPLSIALYLAGKGSTPVLFRMMVTLFSIAAPPIAIPMLAGLVWGRVSNAGATAGFVCGLTVGLVLYALIRRGVIPISAAKVDEIIYTFATAGTTLMVMIVVSVLLPAKGERARRCAQFVEKLRRPVEPVAAADRGDVPSPWRAGGWSVTATAILLLVITPSMGWNAGAAVNLVIAIGLLAVGVMMILRSARAASTAEKTP